MNFNLQKLFLSAQKPERLGIGLMSGTSLDGLDVALCKFSGHGFNTCFELVEFETLPYPEDFKSEIRQVCSKKTVNLEKLTLLNAFIGTYHASLVLQCLNKWKVPASEIDFIASHGQTVYHAPKILHRQIDYSNATLQIGDGDHIAFKTGILTISDFRQKHVAAGGQGAPLALYGDVILGSKIGENRVLLNIGGIANMTWLPYGKAEEVFCTDIGPGNTLIDATCKLYFNKDYDEDSKIALSGKVNAPLLNALLDHSFFEDTLMPKTTGPELFDVDYVHKAQQLSATTNIPAADVVATLSQFTAQTIAGAVLSLYDNKGLKLFASGGGAHNLFIMEQVKRLLPHVTITNTNELGINPDAKEAILFALLGNEAMCGEPIQTGNNPKVLMGKFSFPR